MSSNTESNVNNVRLLFLFTGCFYRTACKTALARWNDAWSVQEVAVTWFSDGGEWITRDAFSWEATTLHNTWTWFIHQSVETLLQLYYYFLIVKTPSEVKKKKRSIRHHFRCWCDPSRLGFMETGGLEPGIALACEGRRADFRSEWEVKNEEQPLTATEALFRTLFHLLLEFFLTDFRTFSAVFVFLKTSKTAYLIAGTLTLCYYYSMKLGCVQC